MSYPSTLDEWMVFCGRVQDGLDRDDTRTEAELILTLGRERGGWVNATESDVLALGAAIWREPPHVVSEHADLSPLQALALASEAFRAEIVWTESASADIPELARKLRAAVTSIQRDDEPNMTDGWLRQRAALAAVRQLGGSGRVGIPQWMEDALGDLENWVACDDILDRVAMACEQTFPGRHWRHVYELGWITYCKS